jgi:hypothetical protein
VRITRQAISPRLAIRILRNIGDTNQHDRSAGIARHPGIVMARLAEVKPGRVHSRFAASRSWA